MSKGAKKMLDVRVRGELLSLYDLLRQKCNIQSLIAIFVNARNALVLAR